VFERLRVDASPSLDQMQVLARAQVVRFRREIGDVDDERVALPTTARVPPPLTELWGQMRPPSHGDDALPPLSLEGVVENRYGSRGLYNAPEPTEIWKEARHTTLRQASVLWTVGSIHRRLGRQIVRGRLLSPR